MREETLRIVNEAIAYVVINPIEVYGLVEWNGSETLDINELSKLVWEQILKDAEEVYGYSRAIRFDGKRAIVSHIKVRLVEMLKEIGIEV